MEGEGEAELRFCTGDNLGSWKREGDWWDMYDDVISTDSRAPEFLPEKKKQQKHVIVVIATEIKGAVAMVTSFTCPRLIPRAVYDEGIVRGGRNVE